MATTKKSEFEDSLTIVREKPDEGPKEPMVAIFLPKLEDPGDAGIKVDQYEHVTIANEEREKTYYVRRGERVEIPVSVFMVMKEKYPDL